MYNISNKYSNQHMVVTYGILFIMCTVLKYSSTTANADRETHTACKTDTTEASIPLNCSSNQMIHVISETFGERTSEDNCSVVLINSPTKSNTNDSQGLIVNCNGHDACIERTVCSQVCNFSRPAVEIKYECVTGSKDICSDYDETISLTPLYLHSPGYPKSVGVNHSCVCRVSGSAMELMVIHHRITKGVVQINVTGDETKTWTSWINSFNRIITNNAREIIVVYDNDGINNQQFWTRIRGTINRTECSASKNTSDVSTHETTDNTITTQETSRPRSSVSENTIDVNTTDTTENHSTYSTTTQGTGPPASPTSEDINTTDTTENNSTYSDTTQETGRSESSLPEDGPDSKTVILASCLGVIIILLLLIGVLLFLNFKRARQTTESTGNGNVIEDAHQIGTSDTNNAYNVLNVYENENQYNHIELPIYRNS